jgi:uncharacterized membrane protein (DUF485 family)
VSATDDEQSASPALDAPTPYQEVQRSPEFVALRKRWRRFIFTLSAIFLAWFLVYVLLADFATGFMNTTLGDTNLTVGLVLGLLQFVSTFVIATIYVHYADKNLDPEAERLRLRVEEKL